MNPRRIPVTNPTWIRAVMVLSMAQYVWYQSQEDFKRDYVIIREPEGESEEIVCELADPISIWTGQVWRGPRGGEKTLVGIEILDPGREAWDKGLFLHFEDSRGNRRWYNEHEIYQKFLRGFVPKEGP